jgi:tetratricopeptide (TPR) repeat protein
MRVRGAFAIALATFASISNVRAQPAQPAAAPTDDTPWGRGVSDENKARAEALLGEGNALFVTNQFREALAKYQQAIAAWDHPAIRFNMVRTLIALERPLEAQQSLEKALAYGQGPLEDNMYTEALNYKRLLASQIAALELSCKQAGVNVKVDGEKMVDCPGVASRRMLPGKHVIVGAKPGFLTQTKDVVLLPGKKEPIVVELITIEKATVYRRRWANWKPWAVVGGGVALAGLGLLVDLQAKNELDQLADSVGATCMNGCTSEQYNQLGHAQSESRAITENRIAISMFVAGGVIAASGVVALILNRPKPYVSETRPPDVARRIVPVVNSGGGGLVVTGSF